MATLTSINWAIIGCGDVAERKSGPALYQTDSSQLIAVMRRDGEKAADFARRHGARRWYTTVESLLADPEINAVYVASPHDLHRAHATAAAEAGKIVLCEKPMGTSAADAQAIVAACRANRAPLAVAYYRRAWPAVRKMKELLAEGAIGRPVVARIQLADYFGPRPEPAWLTSKAQAGGGPLANGGSHWIDLMRYLLGEVAEVAARCSYDMGFEVEDTALLAMRMAGGAWVSLSTTWQSPVAVNELDIQGTAGRLLASPLSAGRLLLQRGGPGSAAEPEVWRLPHPGVTHSAFVRELAPALLAGAAPPVAGEEGVACWRVLEAAYRSAAGGGRWEAV